MQDPEYKAYSKLSPTQQIIYNTDVSNEVAQTKAGAPNALKKLLAGYYKNL